MGKRSGGGGGGWDGDVEGWTQQLIGADGSRTSCGGGRNGCGGVAATEVVSGGDGEIRPAVGGVGDGWQRDMRLAGGGRTATETIKKVVQGNGVVVGLVRK
ncbi:hypothetical protein OsI_01958 [Oryza sativa Indica Group]|uniref:Uncharacterized protein n=1 Tax=Oryza sativa subsp. indica TaxID=39946 RepID=B8A889_ORYSI|nr:hypothetical protein OsI_01958 [Oryza sativa Indica Group]